MIFQTINKILFTIFFSLEGFQSHYYAFTPCVTYRSILYGTILNTAPSTSLDEIIILKATMCHITMNILFQLPRKLCAT